MWRDRCSSPLLRIDLGVHVGLAAVARARGLGDRVLHGGEHDPAIDRLFAGDRVGDLQQFEFVGADRRHGSVSLRWLARRSCRRGAMSCDVRFACCAVAVACGARVFALAPCLLRRSDSAISSSVRTSLASLMSSIGSRTSGLSPAPHRRGECAHAVAVGADQARRGTACGRRSATSISICTTWPA